MDSIPLSDIKIPYSDGSNAVLAWAASPTLSREIEYSFGLSLRRAIGFYQRMKLMCWKMFVESPMTVKNLQLRLGLRRPGDVNRLFFKYSIREARSCAWIDAMGEGLDFDMQVSTTPVAEYMGTDYRNAVILPAIVLEPGTVLTPDEAKYVLSGKKMYWHWNGERPSFDY